MFWTKYRQKKGPVFFWFEFVDIGQIHNILKTYNFTFYVGSEFVYICSFI